MNEEGGQATAQGVRGERKTLLGKGRRKGNTIPFVQTPPRGLWGVGVKWCVGDYKPFVKGEKRNDPAIVIQQKQKGLVPMTRPRSPRLNCTRWELGLGGGEGKTRGNPCECKTERSPLQTNLEGEGIHRRESKGLKLGPTEEKKRG